MKKHVMHLHRTIYIIVFLIFTIILGCKKNSSSNDNNDNYYPDPQPYRAHFTGYINGQHYDFGVLIGEPGTTGICGAIITPSNSDSSRVEFASEIIKFNQLPLNNNSLEIFFCYNYDKNIFISSQLVPDSIFINIFHIGQRHYIIDNAIDSTLENGIVIIWTDSNGTKWASAKNEYGITGNNFSNYNSYKYFNVVESNPNTADSAISVNEHQIIADFNCILYNSNNDSISLTDGQFIGFFCNSY